MKNKTEKAFAYTVNVTVLLLSAVVCVSAQTRDSLVSERIAVVARPSADSIVLRWAPLRYNVWRAANVNGYRVERYSLIRNGEMLARPEKVVLHTSVAPLAESHWEELVRKDKYGAIAAQALFGDQFQIDLSQSDVFTIVNKAQENEQRFAFALFSADMSADVAKASGLWFTDTTVNKGEKYLYRVVINTMDSLRGSVFTGPDEIYKLPPPQNLKADFEGPIVSLKWHKTASGIYTAYILQRSEDGHTYRTISESPLVSVTPTEQHGNRHEYVVDTVGDFSKTYHYRVIGLTPFGEKSPPSNVVTGRSAPSVSQVPYISTVENVGNTSLVIHWNFPQSDNDAIGGFRVERASSPQGVFLPLTQNLLPPDQRTFTDSNPGQVNYYQVNAYGLDGERYPSHVFFAQRIDSIPPNVPVGFEGHVEEDGTVLLSWQPNPEDDIYGYRVYKAYHKSEEPAQITSEPVAASSFTDHVNLNTLNETLYYRVMAVDKNQNHSALSEMLKVGLPDKVKPQPPVFHPVINDSLGITLRWVNGSSEEITHYKLFRRTAGDTQWQQVSTIEANGNTVHAYLDTTSTAERCYYTMVAVDRAGLESDPASPVTGIRFPSLLPPVRWKKPRIDREQNQIILAWAYGQPDVETYKVYKSVNHRAPVLYKTLEGDKKEFRDTMIPGRSYRYRIIALFQDGKKSLLSEELQFEY